MIKTDVLIVGGSLAGMCAAITAKEQNPEIEVTVVEKYTTGYAGKANRGAGITARLLLRSWCVAQVWQMRSTAAVSRVKAQQLMQQAVISVPSIRLISTQSMLTS